MLQTLFFTIALAFLLPNLILCWNHCDFPAIFNFGDSNSDTGGLSAAFGQAPPPHGETFFHAPAGRYSDGRLVIDFIAENLTLPYLSAYLDSVGSNFSHGANFVKIQGLIVQTNRYVSTCTLKLVLEGIFAKDFIDLHRMQDPDDPDPEYLKEIVDVFFRDVESRLNEVDILLKEQEVDYRKLEENVVSFRESSER
ncbi:hypothetical protein AgCh_019448 [Apium graveolens]